jgi:hypothetical protein
MRGRLMRFILLSLLLGAIVNVAVAWGCALSGTSSSVLLRIEPVNLSRARGEVIWRTSIGPVRPDEHVEGWKREARGVTVIALRLRTANPRAAAGCWMFNSGRPLRSFGGLDYGDQGGVVDRSTLWSILPHRTAIPMQAARIPLYPRWPGFAVNTLFYATILWLVIPGPFVLRRLVRRRRGRCPQCGYDLRHALSAGCPECGWNRPAETESASGVDAASSRAR